MNLKWRGPLKWWLWLLYHVRCERLPQNICTLFWSLLLAGLLNFVATSVVVPIGYILLTPILGWFFYTEGVVVILAMVIYLVIGLIVLHEYRGKQGPRPKSQFRKIAEAKWKAHKDKFCPTVEWDTE
jgi:hypothetical protein